MFDSVFDTKNKNTTTKSCKKIDMGAKKFKLVKQHEYADEYV